MLVVPAGPGPAASQVGVGQLLASSATGAIIIVNIVNHWGYFIYLNWIPSYLHASFIPPAACLTLWCCPGVAQQELL